MIKGFKTRVLSVALHLLGIMLSVSIALIGVLTGTDSEFSDKRKGMLTLSQKATPHNSSYAELIFRGTYHLDTDKH
jgi:hypothetical protein